MAKPSYVVQTFKKGRGGLVPGDRELAASDNGARKKAAAMASRFPGTAALRIETDDETGELRSAEILATHGEVPDDFADTLRGG